MVGVFAVCYKYRPRPIDSGIGKIASRKHAA